MESEPGIGRDELDRDDGGADDALATYVASLPPCPGIKFIDDNTEEEDRQADLDRAAGRVYPHSVVGAWLKTWGSPDYKPFDEWLKSSG